MNYRELAKDVGSSLNTIKQWTNVLEASNQIYLLEPFFSDAGKRVIKSPKVFFNEVGMLCYLLGLDRSNIAQSATIGNVWEALICAEFRKAIKNRFARNSLWFYRDQSAREIDFLYQIDNTLEFFEVKWSATSLGDKELKALRSVYADMAKKGDLALNLGRKFLLPRYEKPSVHADVELTNIEYFLANG